MQRFVSMNTQAYETETCKLIRGCQHLERSSERQDAYEETRDEVWAEGTEGGEEDFEPERGNRSNAARDATQLDAHKESFRFDWTSPDAGTCSY